MILTEEDRTQLEDELEEIIGKHAFDAIEAAVLEKLAILKLPKSACDVSPYEVNQILWNAGHEYANCGSPLFTDKQLRQAYAQGAASQLCKK